MTPRSDLNPAAPHNPMATAGSFAAWLQRTVASGVRATPNSSLRAPFAVRSGYPRTNSLVPPSGPDLTGAGRFLARVNARLPPTFKVPCAPPRRIRGGALFSRAKPLRHQPYFRHAPSFSLNRVIRGSVSPLLCASADPITYPLPPTDYPQIFPNFLMKTATHSAKFDFLSLRPARDSHADNGSKSRRSAPSARHNRGEALSVRLDRENDAFASPVLSRRPGS
jgi:hypothetical protein